MTQRKLIAAIACRNKGTRLYGKPLQNIDITGKVTILDTIIRCLQKLGVIDEIILGIAEGVDNLVFITYAEERGLRYVVGSEADVLSRLIACGELGGATDIFRITSESPFLYHEPVADCWKKYREQELDALFMDEIIDGCGFEIISLAALRTAHEKGQDIHKDACSLYIRENKQDFRVVKEIPPPHLVRRDLRLTVDYPEDLVVCRALYKAFIKDAPLFNISSMVTFLDAHPELKALTLPFAEAGYASMYK